MPPGSLVADSEVGYTGFERLDLRILDPRGLTDATIAHHAPASTKSDVGVTELDLGLSGVCRPDRRILRHATGHGDPLRPRPASAGHRVLAGTYRLEKLFTFRGRQT